MKTKITKSWLDYAFSSNGSVSVHIEDIRDFVIEEISKTDNHQSICRVFETLTGETVDNGESLEDIKSGYKVIKRHKW